MVSKKKEQELQELVELIKKYPVVGILDLFKLPSRQLQFIRKDLRNKVLIKMSKKRLIQRALTQTRKEKLSELKAEEPALILTDIDPFKLHKILDKNKSPTYAKANDIAPKDIIIPEGPTKLPAGPAIGELQRVKIPAMVKEGKIHVRKDTVIVKKGEVISKEVANVLKKLDIQPMEISINLLGAWENGIVYKKDILAVSEEEYVQKIMTAYTHALNLSVNVCYPNKESIKILIQKGFHNAKNLGINAEIFEKGVIEDLLSRAEVQAKALKSKVGG